MSMGGTIVFGNNTAHMDGGELMRSNLQYICGVLSIVVALAFSLPRLLLLNTVVGGPPWCATVSIPLTTTTRSYV